MSQVVLVDSVDRLTFPRPRPHLSCQKCPNCICIERGCPNEHYEKMKALLPGLPEIWPKECRDCHELLFPPLSFPMTVFLNARSRASWQGVTWRKFPRASGRVGVSSGCGHSNRVTPVLSRYRQAEVWFEEFFFGFCVFVAFGAESSRFQGVRRSRWALLETLTSSCFRCICKLRL